MTAKLREKETGAPLTIVQGDMTTAQAPGPFGLVLLVFNTITNLTSQASQTACFRNAAAHLQRGGRFVIEVDLPPVQELPKGQTLRAFARSDTHWGMDEFDTATQAFTSHHIYMRDGVPETFSLPLRYVWPSELNLMAELAGLRLEHRWADWSGAPFDADATGHVSVWIKD